MHFRTYHKHEVRDEQHIFDALHPYVQVRRHFGRIFPGNNDSLFVRTALIAYLGHMAEQVKCDVINALYREIRSDNGETIDGSESRLSSDVSRIEKFLLAVILWKNDRCK